jgi:hypothetical protein
VCSLGAAPLTDPVGPASTGKKSFRGGSWGAGLTGEMRCSWRSSYSGRDPGETFADAGLRCARTAVPVVNVPSGPTPPL